MFGLARTDTLRVLVSVPQTFAMQIRSGIKVNLLVRELPGRTFPGVVSNVSGAIDAVSRTLLAEVHIPNQSGFLLPGMYALVHFNLPKTRGALLVPTNTLIYDAQGTRVVTVTPDSKIHFVPIVVGRDFGTQIEVIQGLTDRDKVVTNPSDDLAEGLKVQAKATPPAPAAQQGQPGQPGQTTQAGSAAPSIQPGQPGQMGAPVAGHQDSS